MLSWALKYAVIDRKRFVLVVAVFAIQMTVNVFVMLVTCYVYFKSNIYPRVRQPEEIQLEIWNE